MHLASVLVMELSKVSHASFRGSQTERGELTGGWDWVAACCSLILHVDQARVWRKMGSRMSEVPGCRPRRTGLSMVRLTTTKPHCEPAENWFSEYPTSLPA